MAKFPHYLQLDAMDCGPACLRMIASHYGREFNQGRLRELCMIGKGGVSMLGITEAAEKIGLRALGVRLTFKKWWKRLRCPASPIGIRTILWWFTKLPSGTSTWRIQRWV